MITPGTPTATGERCLSNGERGDLRHGGKRDRRHERRGAHPRAIDRKSERKLFVSRHVVAKTRKMAKKRKGSSTPSCSRARKKSAKEGRDKKDDRDAREVENARLLDKLPKEVWEKIFGEFEDAELFPLALSCRYFRQKQKELLARPRQRELEWFESPSRALATDISRWPQKGHRASAEYLRFIRREKVPRDVGRQKAKHTRRLAAYHGHLPLLQELLDGLKTLKQGIAQNAGGSPLPQSLLFCFGF